MFTVGEKIWLICVLGASLAWVTLSQSRGAEWATDDMNTTIEQTNFVVNRGCSGTLIDLKERLVLTAHHCIDDQYETVEQEEVDDKGVVTKKKIRRMVPGTVSQFTFQGAESVVSAVYRTQLKVYDRERDLAVVQVKAPLPNDRAAGLACASPRRGDVAYVVGNPMGSLYSSVTKGIVASLQRTYDSIGLDPGKDKPLMQISGGVVGGNSGGSVYNEAGRLIGVPVLAHRVNEVLGFAVPLDEIKQFLADNKIELACRE